MDKYQMEAFCNNCKHTWVVYIPKGTSVGSFRLELLCPKCDLGNININAPMNFK